MISRRQFLGAGARAGLQGCRQRAGVVRAQTRTMGEHTRDRADAIIARCMRAKGFAQAP